MTPSADSPGPWNRASFPERSPAASPDVTLLLARASAGSAQATNELMPLVYAELRDLAARYLASERPGHTLQPTALINEAYLRLVRTPDVAWENRAHFFGAAARAIRRILTDHARARRRQKRGGGDGVSHHVVEALAAPEGSDELDLVALDEALTELAAADAQKARVVELRYYSGLSVEETSRVLGISARSVARAWEFSRVWLHARLGNGAAP